MIFLGILLVLCICIPLSSYIMADTEENVPVYSVDADEIDPASVITTPEEGETFIRRDYYSPGSDGAEIYVDVYAKEVQE